MLPRWALGLGLAHPIWEMPCLKPDTRESAAITLIKLSQCILVSPKTLHGPWRVQRRPPHGATCQIQARFEEVGIFLCNNDNSGIKELCLVGVSILRRLRVPMILFQAFCDGLILSRRRYVTAIPVYFGHFRSFVLKMNAMLSGIHIQTIIIT